MLRQFEARLASEDLSSLSKEQLKIKKQLLSKHESYLSSIGECVVRNDLVNLYEEFEELMMIVFNLKKKVDKHLSELFQEGPEGEGEQPSQVPKVKTVLEQKCHDVPEQECHTRYEEQCNARYEQDCQYQPEQFCGSRYETEVDYVTKQTCGLEQEEKCYNVPENKCHQTQHPVTKYREEQECHTKYKEQCSTRYEESCHTVTEKQCKTVTVKECNYVNKHEKWRDKFIGSNFDETRQGCNQVPKQTCPQNMMDPFLWICILKWTRPLWFFDILRHAEIEFKVY